MDKSQLCCKKLVPKKGHTKLFYLYKTLENVNDYVVMSAEKTSEGNGCIHYLDLGDDFIHQVIKTYQTVHYKYVVYGVPRWLSW